MLCTASLPTLTRAACFALALAFVPAPASAGPVEQLLGVVARPNDADVIVLPYEYGGEGLLFTRDGGASWQLLCAASLRPTGLSQTLSSLGRVAFDAEGVLHMGTFGGMLRDDGTACAWESEGPFAEQWVTDIVNHPTDPSVLFAITSSGGEGKMNGVYRREGATGDWEALGSQDSILISRLHVVDLGGGLLRIYQGAVRGMLGMAPDFTPNYIVRVSDDLGESWTEHPFGASDGTVRLEAVDPTNPDRIVAVVDHQGASPGATGMPDELLVSDDQGATFAKWATVTEFGGIAVAPDGRTWYGDNGDPASTDGPRGIYGAASLGAEAKQINGEMRVACLGYRPASGDLFACDRFEAGFVDATSGAYTKSFGFRDVASFIECPERDLCAESERQMLGAWCGITHFPESDVCCCYPPEAKGVDPKSLRGAEAEAILCPGDLDAGMLALPDAGPPGSGGTGGASGTGGAGGTLPTAGTAANDDGGCSCRTPGGEARTAPVGLVALAVACFAWRRRRARRHR